MTSFNMIVNCTTELLYKTPQQSVLVVSLANERIGFIGITPAKNGNPEEAVPFTEHGELEPEHCIGCAMKVLFRMRTGIKTENIAAMPDAESLLRTMLSSRTDSAPKNSMLH